MVEQKSDDGRVMAAIEQRDTAWRFIGQLAEIMQVEYHHGVEPGVAMLEAAAKVPRAEELASALAEAVSMLSLDSLVSIGHEKRRQWRHLIASETRHASDCAVHNEPAYPNEPCDCGVEAPK